MKKLKVLVVLAISTLLLIPFGSFAKAQTPSYVGVSEGDIYTWSVQIDADGIDELMDNIGTLIDDLQVYVANLDLGGYENLTIPEIMVNISSTVLNAVFPDGWEGLNVTELLHAFIGEFMINANVTMFSGNIPGDWESLNITEIMNYAVDGLNDTLPAGWEDSPIPPLIPLAISALNESLLFGYLPDGWEDFTIRGLINEMLMENIPELYESFMLHMLLNEVIDLNIPTGMDILPIKDIISSVLPSSISSINISYLQSVLPYMLPPEVASANMSVVISGLLNNLSGLLPPEYVGVDMSTILDNLINQMMYNASLMLVPDVLPVGFEDLTIQELATHLVGQLNTQWDTEVMPDWQDSKSIVALFPGIGFRAEITGIGPEVEAYSGGPKGVPLNITFSVSLDMNNWTSLSGALGGGILGETSPMIAQADFGSIGSMVFSNLSLYYSSYIIDPSTYSEQNRALMEQAMLTGGLFVANNYNWHTVQTNFTVPVGLNTNGILGQAEWDTAGVMSSFTLDANGVNAVTIKLLGEGDEIPGYEAGIILTIAPITIFGLIYYMKKKNRIK